MHTLPYPNLSIVLKALSFTISEHKASNGAGNERDEAWPFYIACVPEVFLVEADGLKMIPVLTAFSP